MCLKSNKRLLALVIVSVFAGAAVAAGSSREPSASEDRVPAVGSRASSRSSSARDRPARMGRSERHRTVARVPGLEARVDELGRAVSELSAASSRESSRADASATVDHSDAIREAVDEAVAPLQRTITDQADVLTTLRAQNEALMERLAALESRPAPTVDPSALEARLVTLEAGLKDLVLKNARLGLRLDDGLGRMQTLTTNAERTARDAASRVDSMSMYQSVLQSSMRDHLSDSD